MRSWLPGTPELIEQTLRPWRQVAEHADAFFSRVAAAHGAQMHCGPGCNECCHPTLTLIPAEALAVLLGLARAATEELDALREPSGERCCLLHPTTGRCIVYPLRPLICRTHGLPIQYSGALMGQRAEGTGEAPPRAGAERPKTLRAEGTGEAPPRAGAERQTGVSCCPLNFKRQIPAEVVLNGSLLAAQLLVANSLVTSELEWPESSRLKRVSAFRLLERGRDAL